MQTQFKGLRESTGVTTFALKWLEQDIFPEGIYLQGEKEHITRINSLVVPLRYKGNNRTINQFLLKYSKLDNLFNLVIALLKAIYLAYFHKQIALNGNRIHSQLYLSIFLLSLSLYNPKARIIIIVSINL